MKVVTVLGTRPNFNKEMLINRLFKEKGVKEIIVNTGQHYDYEMCKIFFDQLDIPEPDYNFNIGSGLHGEQTAKIIMETEKLLLKEKPDFILVYGDVDTTMGAAIAAAKLKIPTVHIEGGPRNRYRYMPEEINRIVTDHIAELNFAPTRESYDNLIKENIPKENCFFVGDIMKDNILYIINKFRFPVVRGDYHVATVHRAENSDSKKRLTEIFEGMIMSKEKIILPLHPRTRKNLERFGMLKRIEKSNIMITKPLGYVDFVKLLAGANKVLSDSGGVRREAYILGKPLIVLIDEKGLWWPEIQQAGWSFVAGPGRKKIKDAIKNFEPKGTRPEIFGDGRAAKRIVDILIERYGKKKAK